MIPRSAPLGQLNRISYLHSARRFLSKTTAAHNAPAPASEDPPARPHAINPRWLTMMKRRIGRCMMFGLRPAQIDEGGKILQQLARDWRELLAGSEGFLTDEKRRSLFRHSVVWGHVNNVTYARYAESARVIWTRNIGTHIDPEHKKEWLDMVSSRGIGLILKSLRIEYKFPMKSPDKITVYQKLVRNPDSHNASNSAFQLEVLILSEARQRPAARCYEENTIYNYKKNQKTSQVPTFILEQFRLMWELQENAKSEWQQRILDIESRVRTLEVESWDRADAVEDNGSAS
ncbi:hypothetical protein N7454_001107 [Penicillium verhagenii]|nr:hypothetical protein N7454_001107 [Penicillium verhagenii]